MGATKKGLRIRARKRGAWDPMDYTKWDRLVAVDCDEEHLEAAIRMKEQTDRKCQRVMAAGTPEAFSGVIASYKELISMASVSAF